MSAIGYKGVFWKYGEPTHSSQICGVGASRLRNWRTRRDLPMPASPEINITCPSPSLARCQRSHKSRVSSSRPTNGVRPCTIDPARRFRTVRRQNLLDKLAMDLREDLVHLS